MLRIQKSLAINGELGALTQSIKNVHHLNWTDQLALRKHHAYMPTTNERRKMELKLLVAHYVMLCMYMTL